MHPRDTVDEWRSRDHLRRLAPAEPPVGFAQA
jgi:hypothetical protein